MFSIYKEILRRHVNNTRHYDKRLKNFKWYRDFTKIYWFKICVQDAEGFNIGSPPNTYIWMRGNPWLEEMLDNI